VHEGLSEILSSTTPLCLVNTARNKLFEYRVFILFKRVRMKISPVYNVSRLEQPIVIDGNWNKPQWQNVQAVIKQSVPDFHQPKFFGILKFM